MDRETKRQVVATLIKADRRDLARRFVGVSPVTAAAWKNEGQNVHILQTTIKGKDAVGKPKRRNIVLRIDGRDGTFRVDYLGMLGHIWEAIDGGDGLATLAKAKKYAAKWMKAWESNPTGDKPNPRDIPR
jgi:hypothetical protein